MKNDKPEPTDWLEAVCNRAGATSNELRDFVLGEKLLTENEQQSFHRMTCATASLLKGFDDLVNTEIGKFFLNWVIQNNEETRNYLQKSLRQLSARDALSVPERTDSITSDTLDKSVKSALAMLEHDGIPPTNSEITAWVNRSKRLLVFEARAEQSIEKATTEGTQAVMPDPKDFTPVKKEAVRQSIKRQGLQGRVAAGRRGNPDFTKSNSKNP